ncbi:MAG TPA: hypothetical protein VL983_05940 [Terriglobales bacterium]|nr:hypothetical protein [Terriglobales bacterium]
MEKLETQALAVDDFTAATAQCGHLLVTLAICIDDYQFRTCHLPSSCYYLVLVSAIWLTNVLYG